MTPDEALELKGRQMHIFLVIHEERVHQAAFSTRDAAQAWIDNPGAHEEKDYTFSIEELTVDAPA